MRMGWRIVPAVLGVGRGTLPANHAVASGARHWGRWLESSSLAVVGGMAVGLGTTHFASDDKAPVYAHSSELHKRKPQNTQGLESCISHLRNVIGTDKVHVDSAAREAHSSDHSFHRSAEPDAVIFPATTEDVQEVMRTCNAQRIPVVAYGAGTSLEGHILPINGGVVLDFSDMAAVLAIRPNDLDATVQPGISYNDLNAALEPHGLFFPPDPGAGASIGGMVGTSCAGTNAVRHGTMKENVLNLTVVLADGTLLHTRRRSRKSSAGYDLTHLFVGAEGTLGIVTEVSLRLHPVPEKTGVAMCSFNSIGEAAATAAEIVGKGIPIGRMELMDEVAIEAVNKANDMTLPEKPLLLFEFAGSEPEVEAHITNVEVIAKANHGDDFVFATDPEEMEELWRARKEAYWSAYALRPNSEIWTTDVCVPLSALSNSIKEAKSDLNDAGIIAPLLSHAGDGNFHLLMLVDPQNPEELERAGEVNRRMVLRAIEVDGTCTGEHGIGLGKSEFLETELGPEAVALMKKIKEVLDPNEILNPGKVLPDSLGTEGRSEPSPSFGKRC